MEKKMKIDKEFKSLIFPLSDDEYKLLEQNIIRDGCRDALVVWKEEDILLDGHNRYEICQKNKIDFKTKGISLSDRLSAADWIDSNQLGRRNLSPDMMRLIRGRLYNRLKKSIGAPIGSKNASKKQSSQNDYINSKRTAEKIAQQQGVSSRTVQRDGEFAKQVESKPELMKAIKERVPVKKVIKEMHKEKYEKDLKAAQEKVTAKAREKFNSVCDIRCCSMKDLLTSGIKPDCIITDPPYPKKYLHLYEELAELSKSIPLVAVMCGQSYLPDIIATMIKHIQYRWTLAYLTPGGQAAQQWESKINSFWKPVLLFGKGHEWIGDVCKSDANDKRFHEWGQSESGMADLIDRLSEPGQIVCDPFVGGGTTALISLRLGRRFVGCDIDKGTCEKAIRRCEVDFKL
jgi:hypothetical protein